MSTTLLPKRLFEVPAADCTMPQCIPFTPKRSSSSPLVKAKLVVTPMRFSENRSEYFTTNTKGEIVQIQNPLKQFKSVGRASRKFAIQEQLQCPVRLGSSKEHPSKSYKSIPSLRATKAKTSLESVLRAVRDSKTDREAAKNPVLCFLVQKLTTKHGKYSKNMYEEIPNTPEFKPLNKVAKLTYFHAYTEENWTRVKEFIMEIVKVYQLDAILRDTPEEYRAAFGHRTDFVTADTWIAHTILSLIHFTLFNKRSQETHCWKKFASEVQKTKFLINLIDEQVTRFFQNHQSGALIAQRARLQFTFPRCKELTNELCLSESKGFIIKLYVRGIDVNEEWSQFLYQRSVFNNNNTESQIKQLKTILRHAKMCAKMDPWHQEDENIARMEYQLKFLTKSDVYVNPEDFVIR